MLIPRVSLNRSQTDQIAAVCALGPDALARVTMAVEAEKTTIKRENVESIVSSIAGEQSGKLISRLVFGILAGTGRDLSRLSGILDSITLSIQQRAKDDDRFLVWPECRGPLEALMRTKSVSFSAKAQDISYDFERVCLDLRILTSIRPVYDEDRTTIQGASVTQTLRLDYLSPSSKEDSLSVALDISDINKLRKLCDEAIKKADEAKRKIISAWGVEAIAPGEETE